MSFDIMASRRSFYAAFNNICSRAKLFLEELVQVALHMKFTLFAVITIRCWCRFIKQAANSPSECMLELFIFVFNFNRWESVKRIHQWYR